MTEILFSTAENPLPEVYRAGFFKSHDGLDLRYGLFKARTSPSKGTIVLLQGRNETIEKYAETIRDFTEAGLWVAMFDLRGQGGSAPVSENMRPGHVHRFSDYEKDLDTFFKEIVLPDAKLPFFLVAHSTGGLIALSAAPTLANRIERMVVASPFLGLTGSSTSSRLIAIVAGLASIVGFGKRLIASDRDQANFENNKLTSDRIRFERNRKIGEEHPELVIGPPTWRWLHECIKAQKRVSSPQHLASIAVPTLMLSATEDSVVSYPAEEQASRYFRAGRMIPINGAQHELFQEADKYRAQALAAIFAFIPGGDAEPMTLDDNTPES